MDVDLRAYLRQLEDVYGCREHTAENFSLDYLLVGVDRADARILDAMPANAPSSTGAPASTNPCWTMIASGDLDIDVYTAYNMFADHPVLDDRCVGVGDCTHFFAEHLEDEFYRVYGYIFRAEEAPSSRPARLTQSLL